jgi:hypothetical protein
MVRAWSHATDPELFNEMTQAGEAADWRAEPAHIFLNPEGVKALRTHE